MIRVDEFEQICKDSNFLNAKSSEINILITKLLGILFFFLLF